MARLPRPYIPVAVRAEVVWRQLVEANLAQFVNIPERNKGVWVERQLRRLFGDSSKVELHHRPALVNRRRNRNEYNPPANDPAFLVYLPEDEHVIETRVRGPRGQHSDLAIARKRKRAERKNRRLKYRWPSRPLRSASRWPAKRTRKFGRKAR
jgi:hypothetical protein